MNLFSEIRQKSTEVLTEESIQGKIQKRLFFFVILIKLWARFGGIKKYKKTF